MLNKSQKGLIFDIQGHTVHDGPGCRTLVFFSGCPLRCFWCSNPESVKLKQRVLYRQNRCETCYSCVEACMHDAISFADDSPYPQLDRSKESHCSDYSCVSTCYHEALVLSGNYYSVDELMCILKRDQVYWGNNGGVTFGGGDPIVQHDFLLNVLKECKRNYIHTAIETSAHFKTSVFLDVMQSIDWAFIDIKHMDPAKHKKGTGVDNNQILSNIKELKNSKWPGKLIIRTPVIMGYNYDYENLCRMIDFLQENEITEINLLPLHNLGESKYTQLGEDAPYSSELIPPDEFMNTLQNLFASKGLTCYLGSDIPV